MTLDRRSLAIALALGALAIAFFGLRPKPTGGPPFRDFESYWSAGRAASAGVDPYGRGVWPYQQTIREVVATRDELLPFVGPPYGLPFWRLLGRLPFAGAIWIWGAVLGVSLIALALGSLRLAGRPIDPIDVVAVAALCAGFGPLTSGLGLGQVAVVASAAVVAALLVAPTSRAGLAVAAFAAALQPNLALVLAPMISRARILPLAVAAVTAMAVATLEPFGNLRDYLKLLAEHGEAERFIAIQTTIAGVARGFGVAPGVAIGCGYATLAIVAALAIAQCLRGERPLVERVAIACAAVPLALPFSHEHDFTIAFFPAIYAIRMARGLTFDIAAFGTILIAVDWLGLAQRPTGILETAAFAVVVSLALVALAPREDAEPEGAAFRGIIARGRSLVLAPVVVALGSLAHRLPTWPDALARNYHAPSSWSVTAVWFDEQARSGIAALDPWWAALRALSLLGCVVVWVAVVRAGEESRAREAGPGMRRDRLRAPASPRVEPPRSVRPSTPPQPVAAANPSSSRTP